MEIANNNTVITAQSPLKGQTLRLTKRAIQQMLQSPFPLGKTQIEVSDSDCRGLRVLISRTGAATFYARFHWKHRRYSKRLGEFTALSLDSAREDAMAYRLSVQKGEAFVPKADQKLKFTDVLKRYLEYSEATKKSSSSDRSKVFNHLNPFFGDKVLIMDVTKTDVLAYLEWLKIEKKLAESTRDKHLALLQAVYRFSLSQNWVQGSACNGLKMINPNNAKLRYLSLDELGAYIKACRKFSGDAYRAFELLAALGLRISEVLSLRLENWDRDSNTIFLPDSKTGARHIPLNQAAIDLLEQQALKYGNRGLAFKGKSLEKPMSTPTKAWGKVLEAALLNDGTVTRHSIRHSYSSHLLMNGVDQLTVSKLLGHSSTRCVNKYYGHLSEQTLLQASAVASDVINRSINNTRTI